MKILHRLNETCEQSAKDDLEKKSIVMQLQELIQQTKVALREPTHQADNNPQDYGRLFPHNIPRSSKNSNPNNLSSDFSTSARCVLF